MFSSSSRLLAAIVASATVLFSTLVLTTTSEARPNVNRDLLKPGVLKVGTDTPYPPFQFGKPPHIKGFDVDLVNALARKLRLRVEYVDTPFDTIFRDVAQRKFDLVATAATITPERSKVVNFSKPYYDAQLSLVVPRSSGIKSVRGLKRAVVGVQSGTTAVWYTKSQFETRRVVKFENPMALIRAIRKGRVDAIFTDFPIAVKATRMSGRQLRTAQNISVGEKYGLAMNKRSAALRRGINWALGRVKSDGTFKRIYRKWFKTNPPRSLRSARLE